MRFPLPPELSADQRAVLDACNEIASFGTLMKLLNWARNGGTDTWTSKKGEFAQALMDAETREKYLTISDDSTPSAEPPSESYSWSTTCASTLYDDDLTALADDVLRHIELLPPRNRRLGQALPFLVAEEIRKSSRSVLEQALVYAHQGLLVFPVSQNRTPLASCPKCKEEAGCPGKNACRCGVNTCHSFYAATSDPTVIRGWYSDHPGWQVAIRTGACSGVVVLDVDIDDGGLDSLIALQREGFDISGAGVMLSGSGRSFHLYFRHPGGRVPCSQGNRGGLAPGLDVRGDDGLAYAAPTRHPSTDAPYELRGSLTDLPLWPYPAPLQAAPMPAPLRPLQTAAQGECLRVQQVREETLLLIQGDVHHPALLGPLMRLHRLDRFGHRGVQAAVSDIGKAYSDQHTNPAGSLADFERMVDGGRTKVSKSALRKADPACSCDIAWAKALNRTRKGLTRGIAGNTEVKVMRHLLMRAEQTKSWTVSGESQRTIGTSIDVHQATVSKALHRLETLNIISMRRKGRRATSYCITGPWTRKELSIEGRKAAGTSIDAFSRASVHPLFGAGGLGASRLDTFSVLSEWSSPLGRGRLVRLRAGTARQAPDPVGQPRRLPRAALGVEGLTPKQVAVLTGLTASTVRRHLKDLLRVGLVIHDGGLWWRTRFHADAVAEELAIIDTAARKAAEYDRQRRLWWDHAVEEEVDAQGNSRYEVCYESGYAQYVDCQTGEIRWSGPVPQATARSASGQSQA